MSLFKTKKTILDIAPYVPGESKSDSTERLIKLSSNEGAFGPSPKAVTAMQEAAGNMHRYPDGDANTLRDAIAKKNNIDKKNIICGAGSDEIIMFLCQAFAGEGTEVLYSEHGFLMYSIYAKAAGATPISAPEKVLTADPQALLDKVSDKTRLVFLANPNNPTGTYWDRQMVVDFHAQLPKDVILVLDAAYAEFVDDPDYTAGHDLVEQHKNIVVTRTFSKLYGLGGVRLGWGHASDEIIDILNRVRGPFNVNSMAQAAGVAALNDDAFVQQSIAHNKKMRDWVSAELTALGLNVVPSQGNFVIVDFGDEDRAEGCRLYLKEQNIFVRQIGGYGLPTYLRISMGLEDEMKLALSVISTYLKT
jgi:histidinol-phosphate aminotransferase